MDVQFEVVRALERQSAPFADSLGALAQSSQSSEDYLLPVALATRDPYEFETEAHHVLVEAIRATIRTGNDVALREVIAAGTVMLVRWHRHMMSKGLMPKGMGWGRSGG